jgi:hypothetical protein
VQCKAAGQSLGNYNCKTVQFTIFKTTLSIFSYFKDWALRYVSQIYKARNKKSIKSEDTEFLLQSRNIMIMYLINKTVYKECRFNESREQL